MWTHRIPGLVVCLAAALHCLSAAPAPAATCAGTPRRLDPTSPVLSEGWAYDERNTRARRGDEIRLDAADVPNLELRWSFVFPGEVERRAPPIVTEQAVIAGATGGLYAIDRSTGCQIWRRRFLDQVRSGLVLGPDASGRGRLIYFGTLTGVVYAVDFETGRVVWRTAIGAGRRLRSVSRWLIALTERFGPGLLNPTMITGTPKLVDGRLYVPLSSREVADAVISIRPCCFTAGAVVALDAQTGAQIWRTDSIPESARFRFSTLSWAPAGAPIWSSPTVDRERNRLYVGTGQNYSRPTNETSNSVLALNLDTGAVEWTFQAVPDDAWNFACLAPGGLRRNCPRRQGGDLDIGASPILGTLGPGSNRPALFVGSKAGFVVALDPDDGSRIWSTRVGAGGNLGGVHFGMAYDGETLFVPVSDINYSRTRWFDFVRLLFGPLFNLSDFIAPSEGAEPGLYAIDPANGEIRWRAQPGTPYSAAVSSIPGVVFAGALEGRVQAFSAEGGSLLWEFQTQQRFVGPDGRRGRGGNLANGGPIVAGDMMLIGSGALVEGAAGNVMLAFAPRRSVTRAPAQSMAETPLAGWQPRR